VSRRLFTFAALLIAIPAWAEDTPDLPKSVKLIVDQTNEFRKSEKREPLKINSELTKAAEYFAKFMAETDKYGHEADGSKPSERAKKHGYNFSVVLENIAWTMNSEGFKTDALAEGLVTGWKESPGHRKNMLDADVMDIGVAVARSKSSGKYYAVQMFGRPRSASIEVRINNKSDVTLEYTIGDDKYTLEPGVVQTHTRGRPGDVKFQTPKGLSTVKAAGATKILVSGSKGSYSLKKE
jgi:Cysteine-rich secretory protein family